MGCRAGGRGRGVRHSQEQHEDRLLLDEQQCASEGGGETRCSL
jgi:hypothetical protein